MNERAKPKYQVLKEYLVDIIREKELNPGELIPSENELAGKFGISRHTVRQAIGGLVADGWLYREQGKGTFVDKRDEVKSKPAKKIVGVITTYLNDYIFPSIIRGIDGILSENSYNIMLGCTNNQHEKERLCLENLNFSNIAALIVEPTKSALPNPNISFYEDLISQGIPILFIHGRYKELKCSCVVEDDIKAGFIATQHLISLGHRKIGGIFKGDDIQGHLRYEGFQKAHVKSSLSFSVNNIIWFDTEDGDNSLEGSLFKKLEELVPLCSAIVCYNDQIAVRVMDFINSKRLMIPEDISLVSFDDSQLAVATRVKLTTVAHPKERLGEQAGRDIISMINKVDKPPNIKMKPELIIRESTKSIIKEANKNE